MTDSTRVFHAESKSTPEIEVRRSIPEVVQNGKQPFRVRGRDSDEEIYVAGEARMAMKRNGVTADEKVLNLM